jgi:hypothetical protein
MSDKEFKVCCTCKDSKSIDNFSKKSSSPDGLQNVCRSCASLHSRKHYINNIDRVKRRTKDRRKRIRPILQSIILSYLERGCIDCGEKDIVVLDFDHISNKKFNVSTMVHDCVDLNKIEEEISKCEIRCANCHRRKTAKTFSWWRIKI